MGADKVRRFVVGHIPTRESVEGNRWLRPVAHLVLRSELWRFNRRSVPRGVALGLFVGFAIPFAHSVIAPLLAFVVGANVPVAFVTTWASNPFTWAIMWPLAYRIGRVMLRSELFAVPHPFRDPAMRVDADGLETQAGAGMAHIGPHGVEMAQHHGHILHRLAHGGMAFACGLVVEATVLAVVGYVVTSVVWRVMVLRKRRRRLSRAAAAAQGVA